MSTKRKQYRDIYTYRVQDVTAQSSEHSGISN